MSWLTENPTWPLVLCALGALLMSLAAWRTGQARLLAGVVVFAVLGLGVFLFEASVVTSHEEVAATLEAVQAALEANDLKRLYEHIDPAAQAMRDRAAWALDRVTVKSTKLGDLETTFDEGVDPPRATARFLGIIHARDNKGESPYENYVRTFTVRMERREGRWRMLDYSDEPPQGF
jgi:hypothetical protein